VAHKQTLFFTVLDAGKSKINVLTDSVSGEGLFPGIDSHLFTVSSHGGRNQGSLQALFCTDANLTHQGSVLKT
jgi:hypothetical protein